MSSLIEVSNLNNSPIVRIGARFYTTHGQITGLAFEFANGKNVTVGSSGDPRRDPYSEDVESYKSQWTETPDGFDEMNFLTMEASCDKHLMTMTFFKNGIQVGALNGKGWLTSYPDWSSTENGVIRVDPNKVVTSITFNVTCDGEAIYPVSARGTPYVRLVKSNVDDDPDQIILPVPAESDIDAKNPVENVQYPIIDSTDGDEVLNKPTRFVDNIVDNTTTGVAPSDKPVERVGSLPTDHLKDAIPIDHVTKPTEESFFMKHWLIILIIIMVSLVTYYNYSEKINSLLLGNR